MCDALILAEQSCRSRHDFELGHTHIAPCERISQKFSDNGCVATAGHGSASGQVYPHDV
jgi:hypothetical protein